MNNPGYAIVKIEKFIKGNILKNNIMNTKKQIALMVTFLSVFALFIAPVKSEDKLKFNVQSKNEYLTVNYGPVTEIVESSATPMKKPYIPGEENGLNDDNLLSIINDIDTSDPQTLACELIWYSGDHFAQDWADNGQELKDIYMSYMDLLLKTPQREQWVGFEEEIALLYHELADFSDDNIEKTRMYIKAIEFIEDNYYPGSFMDNYELGKFFVNLSVTHPGELSKEGSKVQAIEYFSKARDGNLILALQDYYNELAHTYYSIEEIRINLGDEIRALVEYNRILRSYEGEDLQELLYKAVADIKVPDRFKNELLSNPPKTQEDLQIEDVYLTN